MAESERLSSQELTAILAVGTTSELGHGASAWNHPEELQGGRSDQLSRAELLSTQARSFLRRRRLPVGLGLTVALAGILLAGWNVLLRPPPIDPVIQARIHYVSTYREVSSDASTGTVTATSLRTTLRITSDDPESQLQVTGLVGIGAGLPPIQVTQEGTSIILTTAITCPATVPPTGDLRLRVVRVDKWGRSLAGELPILAGVGGDLLSGHGVWEPEPTDPAVNPVVDVINHYCAQADPSTYSSSVTIGPATSP